MSDIITSSSTSQKSLIDDFFIKIEARRNAILQSTEYTQGRKDKELEKISLIEFLLGCLDRELQDYHQEKFEQIQYIDAIDQLIDIFLQVGIDNLEFYPKQASITYILTAILSVLNNRIQLSLNKQLINEKIYRSLLLLRNLVLTLTNRRNDFVETFQESIAKTLLNNSSYSSEQSTEAFYRLMINGMENDELRDAIYMSQHHAYSEEKKSAYKLNNHIEEDDYFKLIQLKISTGNDVDEIRKKAGAHDIYSIVDQLLIFNEEESDSIWYLQIKLNNQKNEYDAVEFSRYIYILSEALQTIGDIEITIEGTGMGSVWVKLKIRVKTLVSEIDFKQVIEQAQIFVDAGMHNKPITELKKTLAESKKLEAETTKILEETTQLKDNENRKKIEELEVYSKYLDLRSKALSISKDEEEFKMVKLKNLKEISEIISRETLNIDSDIQIQINDLGFISKKKTGVIIENSIDVVESLKTIEPKKEVEHSEGGFE